MIITCPSCDRQVEQTSPPVRGPANDGSEAWLCLKCPTVVCVWCYHDHTATQHPDMYREQPTKGGQKNPKHKKK